MKDARTARRTVHPARRDAAQRGFTLVEAIVVIVITGTLAAIVAVFIRSPVDGYLDTVARSELTDAADSALRRIARDVRAALPNSLRTNSPPNPSCFEFLPAVGGGRYRATLGDPPGAAPNDDVLDFTASDASFNVVASSGLPPAGGYAGAHHVVIYNLGIEGADAYRNADHNRAAIAAASDATTITLVAPNLFPFESPGRRFSVIPDHSVVYSCSGTDLLRSTRAIDATPLATCPSTGTVLVAHVNCVNSFFAYDPAVAQRNGLLTMMLELNSTRGAESVRLYQEVHLDNTP